MENEKKVSAPHPAFWRAVSEVNFNLCVAAAFCTDDVLANELNEANNSIGCLVKDYQDLLKSE